MTGLALKTLAYEWRRFAPATVAVGFSGLLVLMQAAIILGIFSLASAYVTRSGADLWIGYPGVQSLDLGRPVSGDLERFAWANPHVRRVEPFLWGSGAWRTPRRGMVNVYIVGVDTTPGAMGLSRAISSEQRRALSEPDAVIVDAADLAKLGATRGGTAEINGRLARVVDVTHGLRALGGVNVLASVATARRLDPTAGPDGQVAYLLAKVDPAARPAAVAHELNVVGRQRSFEAITAPAFARRTTLYWLLESGAGVAFVFGSIVAVLVAVIITSQTLSAAVASSIKEYAALRALGFSMRALHQIVLAQSAWVGVVGLAAGGVLMLLLLLVARMAALPVVLSPPMIVASGVLVLLTAVGSGGFALRRVGDANPVSLLQ